MASVLSLCLHVLTCTSPSTLLLSLPFLVGGPPKTVSLLPSGQAGREHLDRLLFLGQTGFEQTPTCLTTQTGGRTVLFCDFVLAKEKRTL